LLPKFCLATRCASSSGRGRRAVRNSGRAGTPGGARRGRPLLTEEPQNWPCLTAWITGQSQHYPSLRLRLRPETRLRRPNGRPIVDPDRPEVSFRGIFDELPVDDVLGKVAHAKVSGFQLELPVDIDPHPALGVVRQATGSKRRTVDAGRWHRSRATVIFGRFWCWSGAADMLHSMSRGFAGGIWESLESCGNV